jgi:branched-chain amino acid transport system substrate-binding protein/urea transport system substrate-binding protein
MQTITTSSFGSMRPVWLAWLFCCACILHATTAGSAEPIKIGAVLPFSGGVELYGGQAKLGIDLAVKDINAGGGILGRPVEVLYEDDKTDPAAAVDATRKLIERDRVLALVGPITSRNLNAIAPEVERSTNLDQGELAPSRLAPRTCSRTREAPPAVAR